MADMITRCPKCDTAFRITPAHLRSAKGSVRCGSCLQVFNAKEHLTTGPTPSADDAVPKAARDSKTAVPDPAPKSREPDPDDILISDDMDTDLDALDSGEEYSPDADIPPSSLFERFPTEKKEDDEDEDAPDDESWALKLLDDDEPFDTAKPPRKTHSPGPEPVHQASVEREEPRSRELFTDDEDAFDRNFIDDVIDDDIGEYSDQDADATEEPESPAPSTDDAEPYEPAPFTASRREIGSAYLDAIEPEPVVFSVRSERTFLQGRLLWVGLSALALVVLIGQIAWLQYPTLNRMEPYRSLYGVACGYLGCQLPPQEDIDAIRTSNLVVRSHPRQADALMVDVILQNTAPFPQAFPNLELTFSDLQATIVAQRVFTPAEYLGGELAGQDKMPVKQPIHIAIEIADPGPHAINYQIDVVAR